MKFLLVLLIPVLCIVSVNECTRRTQQDEKGFYMGATTLHSAKSIPDKCSWKCHHSTSYCKQHHVSFLKPYASITDPLYTGIIQTLEGSGNYRLANILLFVFLWPLVTVALLWNIFKMRKTLNAAKR